MRSQPQVIFDIEEHASFLPKDVQVISQAIADATSWVFIEKPILRAGYQPGFSAGINKTMPVPYEPKGVVPYSTPPSSVVCSHAAVRDVLARRSKLVKALVFMDGSIHYEKLTVKDITKVRAALREIEQVVCAELEVDAKLVPYSTLEYEGLLQSQQPKANKRLHSNVAFVQKIDERSSRFERLASGYIQQAINQQSSDLFIDLREADNKAYIAYKTHGQLVREKRELTWEEGKRVVMAIWALDNKKEWTPNGSGDVTVSFPAENGRNFRLRGNTLEEGARDGKSGHSIAIRLRDTDEIIPLEKAGYTQQQVDDLYMMAEAPAGLALFSGKTGSGKSSSLTSIIHHMPRDMRKLEIADPVEVFTPYCVHTDISDMTPDKVKALLQATVRQNPDLLVLGEIRDQSTLAIATYMGQQGARVWSTIHSNSCSGVLPRLENLGLQVSDLASSDFLVGIISQNLVPVLCPKCSLKEHPDKNLNEKYRSLFKSDDMRFQNKKGCSECRNGLKGQTVVAEVYPLLRAGDGAYELIASKKWNALTKYMKDTVHVKSKHEIASPRIIGGLLDPHLTAKVIGFFDPKTDWSCTRDE
ncbi:ATPase, T2SS/T4P/T4SS family [Porticoccaceae bacterium]|nr:ATPase, T2SS/T4P/T4SS family [Porticoccaceae bacterium]